jgi:nucleoside-diphosphate kinase
MNLKEETTFVMIKPDGVRRGLIGEIIKRVEQRGLKIVACVMFRATRLQIDKHYPKDEKWIRRLGEKTASTYAKYNLDLKKELGTNDLYEIGKMVRDWMLDFMISGPVVKMAVQGLHAIDMVRKLCGNTMPFAAELGSIRGDFSVDSAALANSEKRPVYNLIHASENPEEAKHEIKLWFKTNEIHSYKRMEEV